MAPGRLARERQPVPQHAMAQLNLASAATQSVAQALPLHTAGMRIGLLGGSFNPPHEAHRAISLFAIKRLQLARVWWLVSPGNPLKEHGALRSLEQRVEAARHMTKKTHNNNNKHKTNNNTQKTTDTMSYLR